MCMSARPFESGFSTMASGYRAADGGPDGLAALDNGALTLLATIDECLKEAEPQQRQAASFRTLSEAQVKHKSTETVDVSSEARRLVRVGGRS